MENSPKLLLLLDRFNIAADLVDQARDAGLLGIIGLFVWIRFMATRQLTWNKNYNVKPRYIPVFIIYFSDVYSLLENLKNLKLSFSFVREHN